MNTIFIIFGINVSIEQKISEKKHRISMLRDEANGENTDRTLYEIEALWDEIELLKHQQTA